MPRIVIGVLAVADDFTKDSHGTYVLENQNAFVEKQIRKGVILNGRLPLVLNVDQCNGVQTFNQSDILFSNCSDENAFGMVCTYYSRAPSYQIRAALVVDIQENLNYVAVNTNGYNHRPMVSRRNKSFNVSPIKLITAEQNFEFDLNIVEVKPPLSDDLQQIKDKLEKYINDHNVAAPQGIFSFFRISKPEQAKVAKTLLSSLDTNGSISTQEIKSAKRSISENSLTHFYKTTKLEQLVNNIEKVCRPSFSS